LTIAIAVVPVVVVISIAVYTTIFDSYFQRALQAETDDRVPRNANGPSSSLTAIDGAYDCTDNAVVPGGFNAVGIRLDGVSLAIDHYGFQIEDQIVIARHAHDQLGPGTAWNRDAVVITADILVDDPMIDAIVFTLDVDRLIDANGNICSGLQPRVQSPALIPIPVSIAVPIPIAILGGAKR